MAKIIYLICQEL